MNGIGKLLSESEEIAIRFTYHPPKGDQPEKYEDIRDYAHRYAQVLSTLCPDSRERSLALTKLEEVVFWANAAIARRSE